MFQIECKEAFMSRLPRFLRKDKTTVYHVVSRTALDGLPMKADEKDYMLELIRTFSKLFFVDILGFCIMGNHLHLVCRVYPEDEVSDEEVKRRYKEYYGEDRFISANDIEYYRKRWTSLSELVKDIKQGFSKYYNHKHNRKGFFWGDRFKSLIVEEGHTLVNLLAYVDLNPIRAGIVKRPEDYRWSSLGYHIQTGNKDDLLSLDFGLRDWEEDDPSEIVRKYREFVYETGALDAEKGTSIDQKIVERERKRKYKVSRTERFLYRTRYFTDAGIIGSKEFVGEVFNQVKHMLRSKNERRFTPVGGVGGVYSMKKLGS
jgi:REP element-mobilizing transposase RayT